MQVSAAHNEAMSGRHITRVRIGQKFSTYREALDFQFDDPMVSGNEGYQGSINAQNQQFLDDMEENWGRDFTPKKRDTSMGGNDALNAHYSFNEDDDIIPEHNRIGGSHAHGLGSVYDEIFDSQQKLVHIGFGIAKYASPVSFYQELINRDLSRITNNGEIGKIAEVWDSIVRLTTATVVTAIAMPFVAAAWVAEWFAKPGLSSHSKYYDFYQQMPAYYSSVNVILTHLAVNMKLLMYGDEGEDAKVLPTEGVPRLMQSQGLDSLTTALRKYRLQDEVVENADMNSSGFAKKVWDSTQGFVSEFLKGVDAGLAESLLYTSFRLERGAEATETFSSTTKTSNLENTINSGLKSKRDLFFNVAGITNAGAIGDVTRAVTSTVGNILDTTTGLFGLEGTTELLKGSGIIDIPDVWEDSNFATSHQFSIKLRTPSPDPISVFYSLYYPLAYLLAGALPRTVGPNAYTSPFLIRLYSKGLYAIPLGIIDNMTVTRGGAEFGWSAHGYPSQIDITFTVKDLSKVMHMPIGNIGITDWFKLLGMNSSFQEYLATLGGLGVRERTLALATVKRRAATILKYSQETKFSGLQMGMNVGNSKIGRVAAAFYPTNRLPN